MPDSPTRGEEPVVDDGREGTATESLLVLHDELDQLTRDVRPSGPGVALGVLAGVAVVMLLVQQFGPIGALVSGFLVITLVAGPGIFRKQRRIKKLRGLIEETLSRPTRTQPQRKTADAPQEADEPELL